MTRLTLLILFKIGFTALTVAAPFLFLSPDRIAEMTGALAPSPSLYRLYGISILALLIGYASGIPMAQRGQLPSGILLMGLVSNGGAATTLFAFGASGTSFFLALAFTAFAIALLTTLLLPSAMLRTLSGRELASV